MAKVEIYTKAFCPYCTRALRLLAEMLVGGTQSMANWWTSNPEAPREQMVAIAMDFAWLGLERLSRGERWPPG